MQQPKQKVVDAGVRNVRAVQEESLNLLGKRQTRSSRQKLMD